jgi:hypothetical protein
MYIAYFVYAHKIISNVIARFPSKVNELKDMINDLFNSFMNRTNLHDDIVVVDVVDEESGLAP